MLALSREDGVALIVVERLGTPSISRHFLNICSITACAQVEMSYIGISIEHVAVVRSKNKIIQPILTIWS